MILKLNKNTNEHEKKCINADYIYKCIVIWNICIDVYVNFTIPYIIIGSKKIYWIDRILWYVNFRYCCNFILFKYYKKRFKNGTQSTTQRGTSKFDSGKKDTSRTSSTKNDTTNSSLTSVTQVLSEDGKIDTDRFKITMPNTNIDSSSDNEFGSETDTNNKTNDESEIENNIISMSRTNTDRTS